MIKSLLGINDNQLDKKSNFYGYLLTALLGGAMSLLGIGMIIYNYSDMHKKIIGFNLENIKYLEKLHDTMNDDKLHAIIKQCYANIDLIDQLPRQDGLLFFLLGLILLVNFILFLQLRKKVQKN